MVYQFQSQIASPVHTGAFGKLPFRWIYYYGSNKSTGKETRKTNLCALVYQRTSGPLGPVLKKNWRTGPFRTSKLPKGPLRTAYFDPGTIIRFFKMQFLEF